MKTRHLLLGFIACFLLITPLLALGATPVLIDPEAKVSSPVGGMGLSAGDLFGSGVAVLGDVNGDNVPDLAVGAEGTPGPGGSNTGAVWILFMNADGSVSQEFEYNAFSPELSSFLDQDDEFGTAVGAIGDVDGNGAPDVAVGAANDDDKDADNNQIDDGDGINRGAIYILLLNTNGTIKAVRKISDLDPSLTIPNNTDQFGNGIVSLGDLDDVGGSDFTLAVGAPGDRGAGFVRGAVYILFLDYTAAGDLITISSVEKIDDADMSPEVGNTDAFGTSVGALADLDADGNPEFVAGAIFDDDNTEGMTGIGENRGAVYVIRLNDNGTLKAFHKISETQGGFGGDLDQSDFFGDGVAGSPDLDGDGDPELVVGASGDDDAHSGAGAAWLLFLDYNAGTLTVKNEIKISDTSGDFDAAIDADDMLGTSVAVANSDLNGDNNPDLLLGAQGDDDGAASAGAVHLAFLAPPAIDLTKVDALHVDNNNNTFVDPGDVIKYTISGTNLGYLKADNASFRDVVDAGKVTLVGGSATSDRGSAVIDADTVEVTGIGTLTPQTTNPGSDNSFTAMFEVEVASPFPVCPGNLVENQGFLASDNHPQDVPTDDPDTGASDDPTATPINAAPMVIATKADFLTVDNNGNGQANPLDVLEYTIEIQNDGDQDAGANLVFSDTPGANTSLVPGSVTTSKGTVTQGNGGGDTSVQVAVGEVQGLGLETVIIAFRVMIDSPFPPFTEYVANQGTTSGDNFANVDTDDPATGAAGDSTKTPVQRPPVAVCQNIAVDGDSTVVCTANGVTPADVDNGSFDPQGLPITLALEPPGPYTLGPNPVLLIVTNSALLADTCQAVVTVDCPTPVKLAAFTAERGDAGAVLRWKVTEAVDHAGFHVYRETADEERVRLTESLLSGRDEYTFVDASPPRVETEYLLAEVSRAGDIRWHGPIRLAAAPIAPVVLLDAVRPNPFGAQTVITYSIPEPGPVQMSVYDMQGRLVRTLARSTESAGEHRITWDGRTDNGNRASFGMYIIRLVTKEDVKIQKAVLAR